MLCYKLKFISSEDISLYTKWTLEAIDFLNFFSM